MPAESGHPRNATQRCTKAFWIPAFAGMTLEGARETTLRLHSRQQTQRTLYVGVTGDLSHRVDVHRTDAVDGFTKRHGVHLLVYAEFHETMEDAIVREKQIKKWRRTWKVELIQRDNPDWLDLSDKLE